MPTITLLMLGQPFPCVISQATDHRGGTWEDYLNHTISACPCPQASLWWSLAHSPSNHIPSLFHTLLLNFISRARSHQVHSSNCPLLFSSSIFPLTSKEHHQAWPQLQSLLRYRPKVCLKRLRWVPPSEEKKNPSSALDLNPNHTNSYKKLALQAFPTSKTCSHSAMPNRGQVGHARNTGELKNMCLPEGNSHPNADSWWHNQKSSMPVLAWPMKTEKSSCAIFPFLNNGSNWFETPLKSYKTH